MYYFQKGKSPGPNGLIIEFFQGFYDLVKEDLLKAVQESQRVGKVLGDLNSTFLALIPKKQNPYSFEEFRSISWCNDLFPRLQQSWKSFSLFLCEFIFLFLNHSSSSTFEYFHLISPGLLQNSCQVLATKPLLDVVC